VATDLETLLTSLYVKIDDEIAGTRCKGRPPRLTDSELLCLTVQRSNLAGWAGYGYCASDSRFFWGLRLYLVCTPTGMPTMWALASPKIGEREVLAAMLAVDAGLVAQREDLLLAQRILAMATGIWHNNKIGAPVTRSLIAFDH
jgi:hypothetical protein